MDKQDSQRGKELVTEFLANEISSEDKVFLQEWVASSDGNRRFFEEMKLAWQAAGSVDQSPTYQTGKAWKKISGDNKTSYSNRKKVSMGILPHKTAFILKRTLQIAAAAIIVFLCGGVSSYFLYEPRITEKTLASITTDAIYQMVVPKGSQSHLVLPDGSKVAINAGSKLTYTADYDVSSRMVCLEGEAYFDVKSNPEKPFVIQTSHLDIKAYGTAFNVKAYPEDPMIVTTLESGELHIESRDDDHFDMVLQPNQNIIYYKTEQKRHVIGSENKQSNKSNIKNKHIIDEPSPAPTVTDNVNTDIYTSWKDPEWIIDAQTFGSLATSLERKFNVQIIFGSPDLKKYRFSGTIRKETLEQVLNALTLTAPMQYKIDQGVVLLQMDKKRKQNYDVLY